jgi:hypothetical protein
MPMRRSAVTAVLLLLVVASASASRKPTASEASGIRQSFKFFVSMPNSPAAKNNRITSIAVSSLDARYAVARLNSNTVGPSELLMHHSGPGWWVVAFGSSVNCDAAPLVVMRELKVGCSPPNGVAWINSCGPLVSRPTDLVLACGDGNYALGSLRWRGWGNPSATATGVARANTCTPNCAQGHFKSYRMTATASRLTRCGKARYYAVLTITYPGARPAGVARRDVHTLGC